MPVTCELKTRVAEISIAIVYQLYW